MYEEPCEKCQTCKYAVWDYETYYGTTAKQWFITDCKKNMKPVDTCNGYKPTTCELEVE